MKTRSYSVVGDKKQGHRIAVPESTGIQKGDRFEFVPIPEGGTDFLPAGSLVYVPHVDDNAGTGGSDKKKVKK